MNCKQGEWAIVVSVPDRRVSHHIGMIVKCKSLAYSWDGLPCWTIDPRIDDRFRRGAVLTGIADRDLRPFRGSKGDDETLTWAGKPEQVKA